LGHPKSADWRSRLVDLTEQLSLRERVVFAGHLSHQEVASLYATCEVVAVPSSIEGFNLTAVEGWLHKKPCVVSRGAGVSELVQNGVNGFVFNPSNDEELSERLRALLRSTELASKMGENGSMTATVCDVKNAVSSMQEIFEREIARYSG
jgi:glycosyltransferase involved in cell wall biosynthesis